MQSSIFKFFKPAPKPEAGSTDSPNGTPERAPQIARSPKTPLRSLNFSEARDDGSDNDDSPVKRPSTVKKRVILDSSSDEENMVRGKENRQSKKPKIDWDSFSSSPKPASTPSSAKKKGKAKQTDETLNDETEGGEDEVDDGENSQFAHLNFAFLQPDKIRDKSGRASDDPLYDPRTLHVPTNFLNIQSPGMKQWWTLKSDNFDTLLFFKVGKFYELYHMDAVIAVEQLNIALMRGNFAHAGFPEVSFERFSRNLVLKGFKVARIEQTETPEAMSERMANKTSKEKVVRREICQVITPGTSIDGLRSSMTDSSYGSSTAAEEVNDSVNNDRDAFLLVLKYHQNAYTRESEFGVAVLNAKIGKILLGQFVDDRNLSRLRTLLVFYPPSQILVERGNLPQDLMRLIKANISSIPIEILKPKVQFLASEDIVLELENSGYFESLKPHETAWKDRETWPDAVLDLLSKDDLLGRRIQPEKVLAASCFGALIYYLRYCLIDQELLSLGQIYTYSPPDLAVQGDAESAALEEVPFYEQQKHMILDGLTLTNLDIFVNSSTETSEGTVLEQLDGCFTQFGRRLLKKWISAPLCHPVQIRQRQQAVDDLMKLLTLNEENATSLSKDLRKLPDLERLLTKVHLMSVSGADENHPESRAVIFEELTYSKSKIADFIATIQGLQKATSLIHRLQEWQFSSQELRSLCFHDSDQDNAAGDRPAGRYPNLDSVLKHFRESFNHEKAKQEGRIVPEKGVDEDYDEALAELDRVQAQCEDHLFECGRLIGCKLQYFGSGRNRLQMEVPEASVKRVPQEWELTSSRKGYKRYRTAKCVKLLGELQQAEDRKDQALKHIMRRLFAKFSQHFHRFNQAVICLAELDCLLALAKFSVRIDAKTACFPTILELSHNKPELSITDGRHPCLDKTYSGGDVIPNDVFMGGTEQKPNCLVVTGPNMGGKSTLMRQTALIVLLAHLGCKVPALDCQLTPINRIFTRLGASDKLFAGESTFMVEVSECACILRHATKHSFILVDEFGRGTNTADGSALSASVLQFLGQLDVRCLFSTHYHDLMEQIVERGGHEVATRIGVGHMACMLEEEDEDELAGRGNLRDLKQETITFLYKFIPGICPKSYGFNAARMAGIPDQVTLEAIRVAREHEKQSTLKQCLRDLWLARQGKLGLDRDKLVKLRDRLAAFSIA